MDDSPPAPSPSSPQHGPPFRRGGSAARFGIVVGRVGAGSTLDVSLEHHDLVDSTWTTLGVFPSISNVGPYTLDATGCKEELRFAYAFAGGTPHAFHVRVLPPVWRP